MPALVTIGEDSGKKQNKRTKIAKGRVLDAPQGKSQILEFQ